MHRHDDCSILNDNFQLILLTNSSDSFPIYFSGYTATVAAFTCPIIRVNSATLLRCLIINLSVSVLRGKFMEENELCTYMPSEKNGLSKMGF